MDRRTGQRVDMRKQLRYSFAYEAPGETAAKGEDTPVPGSPGFDAVLARAGGRTGLEGRFYVEVAASARDRGKDEEEAGPALAGRVEGTGVVLSWHPTRPPGAFAFEVEQLRAGVFERIASVEAGAGARYEHRMEALQPGRHLFRVREVAAGGSARYSAEVELTVELAEAYRLSEVYPNPFNPLSQFTIAVREAQAVRAELFDVLGRRVAVLLDEELPAGSPRAVTIDGSALSSGLYLVRVAGTTFQQIRRVTLLK